MVPSRSPVDMTQSTNTSQSADRTFGHYPTLDGVRGLAIMMVLVFHFSQGMPALNLSHWATQGVRLLSIGQKGVDLFFVLSGFLITGILYRVSALVENCRPG